MRNRNTARDANYLKLIAIRNGDYDTVAPGLFSEEFDKPLIANLIDTTARDIAEVMAPLPTVACHSQAMASETSEKRQDKRSAIANAYTQKSRLQDQMFGAADRYGSFGFMAYIAEPDFVQKMPVIRMDDNATAHYTMDYLGRVKEYVSIGRVHVDDLANMFPVVGDRARAKWGSWFKDQMLDVARWYDDEAERLIVLDLNLELTSVPHRIGRCPVRIVERPKLTAGTTEHGQFDDVIWVQVARALVSQYTMNALERSVNAPIAVPDDVNTIEIGPDTVIQSQNPQGIGRVNLSISPGLFPEQQMLEQQQRVGSRYPEGRSGSIDASIITGQGVQALMGTFDTQVQTFQRLNASALEDVIGMCFEMDEAYWGDTKKTVWIKDNGAPRKVEYTPSKDINGDYSVDVTYGAIAGLDPNRGLVFILQALAGGLISKQTARKYLPVDLNAVAEEKAINLETVDSSLAATIATFPQLLPGMLQQGMDPREATLQLAELRKRLERGDTPVEALQKVFAPKEQPQDQQQVADPLTQAMQAAQQGGGAGGGAPSPQSPGSDMLMMLAGMSPSGNPQLGASVSRMNPAQG